MQFVEYKLHAVVTGMITPEFIQDGGYFTNPDDDSLIGLIPNDPQYWIPDSLVFKTVDELKTRQLVIHAKYPMRKIDSEDVMTIMTTDEVELMIEEWAALKN